MAEKYNRDKAAEEAKFLTPKEKAELQERLDAEAGNRFSKSRNNKQLGVKERVSIEKDKLKQRQTNEKNKSSLEVNDKKEKIKRIEQKIKEDPRWQMMVKAAHDPLLEEALREYFKELPISKRGKFFTFKEEFELKIHETVSLLDIRGGYRNDYYEYEDQWNKGTGKTIEIVVNGINIGWNSRSNKLGISVFVSPSQHDEDVDHVASFESIEELIDFIILKIVNKEKIAGLGIH